MTDTATATEIEAVRALEDYRTIEEIQRDAWGLEEAEIVPDHVLITAQQNGGLVLGAFEPRSEGGRRMVGFAFGFPGFTSSGEVKHCSHMVGVASTRQSQGIGYRLKLAQRKHVLGQGIRLITWTFDPLESRNGNLNFHKLGGTCNRYIRNIYGDMRDELNGGLPSDRFKVAWRLDSKQVNERVGQGTDSPSSVKEPSLSTLLATGVRILNRFQPGDCPRPPRQVLPIEGKEVLIQIPAQFQRVRSVDMELARAWREHSRGLFEAAFATGYTVVDLLFDKGRSCYHLVKDWETV